MVKSDRAKIFASFSPLRGMYDAYKEKERVVVPKFELLEDREAELNEKLKNIKNGDTVKVTYYKNGEYRKIKGRVESISGNKGVLKIYDSIAFDDIYDIEIFYREV